MITTIQRLITSLLIFSISYAYSQQEEKNLSQRKNYHSFQSPSIEDNSFLIEEAFNQGAGVVQFIQNSYFENITSGNFGYSYTNEIPLKGTKHQFSYTFNYVNTSSSRGFGDMLINYRYELFGKDKWALITPRLSLIVPTSDFTEGLGDDAWGGQFNLPFSKLLSNKLVIHANMGFTYLNGVRFLMPDASLIRHNLNAINVGGSAIWLVHDKFNLMLECLVNAKDEFDASGNVVKNVQTIANPGFRFAFDIGNAQVVPGFSMPLSIEDGKMQKGAFIYLSIEPDYNKK